MTALLGRTMLPETWCRPNGKAPHNVPGAAVVAGAASIAASALARQSEIASLQSVPAVRVEGSG
eukprot:CAMPEP_0115723984 /NCGR_PEP_ID=MMETSP0272-20121206/80541_1 /TAXON_ID=71861 /ORGANISM="Scrippsiella trochoidea, Strain CCMP3099" /LENGTH=63 /DNA_ID=CAMNT_0003167187 /DNA_START=69 /DNA_END=258 /DNA_ORIENTATION=+